VQICRASAYCGPKGHPPGINVPEGTVVALEVVVLGVVLEVVALVAIVVAF